MNQPRASLGDRDYYRKKYGLTWFVRRRERWSEKWYLSACRRREYRRYRQTLHERRFNGVSKFF